MTSASVARRTMQSVDIQMTVGLFTIVCGLTSTLSLPSPCQAYCVTGLNSTEIVLDVITGCAFTVVRLVLETHYLCKFGRKTVCSDDFLGENFFLAKHEVWHSHVKGLLKFEVFTFGLNNTASTAHTSVVIENKQSTCLKQGIHRHQTPPRYRSTANGSRLKVQPSAHCHTAHYAQTWRYP